MFHLRFKGRTDILLLNDKRFAVYRYFSFGATNTHSAEEKNIT